MFLKKVTQKEKVAEIKMDDSWEFNIPGQTKTVTPATPPSPASGLHPPTSEIRRYPEREHRGPPVRLADYEIQSI